VRLRLVVLAFAANLGAQTAADGHGGAGRPGGDGGARTRLKRGPTPPERRCPNGMI